MALTISSCSKSDVEVIPNVVPDTLNSIPTTRGYYKLLANLTANFVYYNQLAPNGNSSPSCYKNYGCLPACCVMAAHYLNPLTIPANYTTFNSYCSGMLTTCNPLTGGTSVTDAYYYLKNNVWSSQIAPYSSYSNANIISTIKTYLNNNRPIAALIKYSGGSIKLPSVNGNLLHFVLIVGLNETTTGNGTIYCYDPNGNPGLKQWDFANFLVAMGAGTVGNKNLLRIGYN